MKEFLFDNRGLIWKDFRQLLPLISVLIAVGAALTLFWQLSPNQYGEIAQYGRYVPLGLPALFSVGAAAITVGQEREQKTMDWLASMPVSPQRLIRAKFLVCLAALGFMWIGCWGLIKIEVMMGAFPKGFALPFLPNLNQESLATELTAILFWHLHSVYVLVCGFYTSWRIKHTFAGLISIVPLAFAPFIVVQIGDSLRQGFGGGVHVTPWVSDLLSLAVTVGAIAVVGFFAWNSAKRVLLPAKEKKQSSDASAISPYAVFSQFGDSPRPVPGQPFRFLALAMLRQSFGHNRLALAGILFMVLLGVIGCTADRVLFEWIRRGGNIAMIWIGCFGVCCLGVFAFSGDGKAERLRFFSDRGVSPATIWFGRHSLAVAVLSIASVLYLVIGMISQSIERESEYYFRVPPLFLVLVAAMYCYNISQWVGQVFRALPISLILAPVLTAVSLFAAGAMMTQGGFNSVHAAIVVVGAIVWFFLPLLATLLAMRRFTDGMVGFRLIEKSLPVLILFIAMPMVPITFRYFSYPRISDDQRALLNQQTESMASPNFGSVVSYNYPIGGTNQVAALTLDDEQTDVAQKSLAYDARDFSASHVMNISGADSSPGGFTLHAETFQAAVALVAYAQMRFEHSPENGRDPAELSEWVKVMTQMASGLRKFPRLTEQAYADTTEAWLADVLAMDAYQPHTGTPIARAAMKQLADKQGRYAGRKKAVLTSWSEWYAQKGKENSSGEFGGYSMHNWTGTHRDPLGQWLFGDDMIDSITINLLELLDAEAQGSSSLHQRRSLHSLVVGNYGKFEHGPYSDRARRDGASQAILLDHDVWTQYPATQWYAAWEKELSKYDLTN